MIALSTIEEFRAAESNKTWRGTTASYSAPAGTVLLQLHALLHSAWYTTSDVQQNAYSYFHSILL